MGTAIDLDEIKRFEVTEVYTHPDAKVDIVLVHGLNGNPRRTWTAPGNGTFWPTQLLPVSLKSAQARVLVYGYNADVYTFGRGKSASSDLIHHHAQTLIANLALERKSEEVEDHPIIFVAHSLGGILVKRALELSNDLTSNNADDNRSIFVSTYGIIFLGTPHNGADPAKWGSILEGMVHSLVPKKILHSESQLVKTLQSNNETLQNINLHFLDIYQKFKICMVHEAAQTDLKGTKGFIVDKASAAPLLPDVQYFGIEATHSGMCKFESKNSPGYTNVSQTIKGWIMECGPVIQARWENERRQRWQIRQAQAAELLGTLPMPPHGSTMANTPDPANSMHNSAILAKSTPSVDHEESPLKAEPYFIKPSGFRPNSIMVGRQAELAELHKMLFDKKRRAEGTSAVLIQSMPGGGKTHVAREYVYKYREHYPGGVFWLRAKSKEELAAGYWSIAKGAALKNLVELDEVESLETDPDQFEKLVKRWLNRRRDWLMVLDGIHFTNSEEIRRFIPDSAGTALIYTSTEKSVTGNYLFMNPQLIKLPLLSAREAQELLLKELDKKEPFSKDDLKHSMQLVQAMGFLPVVIHAVAQRLKSTDEPLAKYARTYSNEPRLRGLGTYKAVVEQLKKLGANETLNLIYILCFFSQHIPVEMIVLGLKALDSPYHIPVKASEPISGRSLNNTFKVLNTFALIDRNEQEQSIHSSQSSRASREMLADNIDVIRLHSVVQGFFVDTLLAEGTLPVWLDHAVRVFCCSYDRANERITMKANAGLVEDYRLYEIHGNRIQEYVVKHLSKHLNQDEENILETSYHELEQRLQAIKAEIDRRTPESSQDIAEGKPDPFQTSIFDRTSSSSDTGPETPAAYDRPIPSISTWGLDLGSGQYASPASLTHDPEYNREQIKAYNRIVFPMPVPEDDGYESDRESSAAMTVRPSQGSGRGASSKSPRRGEEIFKTHHPDQRVVQPDSSSLHRTVKNMERNRYRDHAGAYRSIDVIDPRVSHDTAQGFLQRTNSARAQSRGRLSGQSSAEVALARLSKESPPPARGGGMIQDRRPVSQKANERGRMMTGLSSYAVAVAESTKDTILGWTDTSRPLTADAAPEQFDSTSPLKRPESNSAKESLQRFPIRTIKSSPPQPQSSFTPMPPYPTTPSQHYGSSRIGTYPLPDRYNQANISLVPTPYPPTFYPRKDGPVPFETMRVPVVPHSTPQIQTPSVPHAHTEYRPVSNFQDQEDDIPLSLSCPDIKLHRDSAQDHNRNDSTYYPGHPEFSYQTGGYSSEPMSREPSGQSTHSDFSKDGIEIINTGRGQGRRKVSMAETEPLPSLPGFSPRGELTSYQIYERMRRMREEGIGQSHGEDMIGETKKRSPRLAYARAALVERLEEWNSVAPGDELTSNTARSPSPLRKFSTYPSSPLPPPPVPPNSTLTNTSFSNNPPSSGLNTLTNTSTYPSPAQQQNISNINSGSASNSPQGYHLDTSSPKSAAKSLKDEEGAGAGTGTGNGEPMGRTRSGSGGLRVGDRVVEFGFGGVGDRDVGLGIRGVGK